MTVKQRKATVIDATNPRVRGINCRQDLLAAQIEKQEEDKTYLNDKSTIQCLDIKAIGYKYEKNKVGERNKPGGQVSAFHDLGKFPHARISSHTHPLNTRVSTPVAKPRAPTCQGR